MTAPGQPKSKKNSDGSTAPGVRYLFLPEEVTAGFVLLGMAPPKTELFEDLPAYAGTAPERLIDAKGRLKPEFATIFSILAEPRGSLVLDVVAEGVVSSARLLWANKQQPYMMLGKTADGLWDLAILPTLAQALAVVDEILGLSEVAPRASPFTVVLPTEGLAALIGFGDLIEEEDLHRRLARTPGSGKIPLTPMDASELLRMIETGVATQDLRWGVALALALGADELREHWTIAALEAGIDQLSELGLATQEGLATAAGLGLARLLARPSLAASVIGVVSNGAQATADTLLLYRAGKGLVVGAWQGVLGGRSLTLSEIAPGAALRLIETFLSASPPELTGSRYCPTCRARAVATAHFCAQCGQRLVTVRGGPPCA